MSTPGLEESGSAKGRTGKTTKPSKVIVLRLPSTALSEFPSGSPTPKLQSGTPKISLSSASDEVKYSNGTDLGENASESNATPDPSVAAPTSEHSNTTDPLRRKGIPGPKPGYRRANASQDADGNPKPRGKPGPKRRKLDSEANGSSLAASNQPKLGPKANQGAINAGLRALDRSGKPCRRWNKKTFQLKSFTGVAWDLAYWQTPRQNKTQGLEADGASGNGSSSDAKMEPPSSNIGSEKSSQVNPPEAHANDPMLVDVPSSPVAVAASS